MFNSYVNHMRRQLRRRGLSYDESDLPGPVENRIYAVFTVVALGAMFAAAFFIDFSIPDWLTPGR